MQVVELRTLSWIKLALRTEFPGSRKSIYDGTTWACYLLITPSSTEPAVCEQAGIFLKVNVELSSFGNKILKKKIISCGCWRLFWSPRRNLQQYYTVSTKTIYWHQSNQAWITVSFFFFFAFNACIWVLFGWFQKGFQFTKTKFPYEAVTTITTVTIPQTTFFIGSWYFS